VFIIVGLGRQQLALLLKKSFKVAYDEIPTVPKFLLARIHPFPQNRAFDVFGGALAQYLLYVALWHDQISFRHGRGVSWKYSRVIATVQGRICLGGRCRALAFISLSCANDAINLDPKGISILCHPKWQPEGNWQTAAASYLPLFKNQINCGWPPPLSF
jgi:hypothetical protein